MSRELLESLNGNKRGSLYKFIRNFEGEPRIAWYPSAGEDFRALLYLHPSFSQLNQATEPEPKSPDIFLFTDYYPWESPRFLDNRQIHYDGRTHVYLNQIEELPRLNHPLHAELVDFPEGSVATNRVLFMNLTLRSNILGEFSYPVLYAFSENETFYCEKLVPNNAIITHIIHVRYGGGCCGGGKASGVWLLNVLNQLETEILITDNHYYWQSGDEYTLQYCSSIPKECDAKLTPIRTIPSESWSGHGDVTWNKVTR